MPRFFVSPEDIKGNEVLITGGEARHIVTVLRKRVGDEIDISDGLGNEFRDKISQIESGRWFAKVRAEIITRKRMETEPRVKITLFQSIPKGNRLDFTIQKSIEIGVSEIVPITTERTVVKLDYRRGKERVIRWQKIAQEAAKQSGRNIIPRVGPILDFSQALKEFSEKKPEMGLIAWERERKNRLREVLRRSFEGRISPFRLAIFIGPEGGFTPEEVEKARVVGLVPISLGSRILRSETAGLVVAMTALYESSDLG